LIYCEEIIKNDDKSKNLPHLGFAFSQDIVESLDLRNFG